MNTLKIQPENRETQGDYVEINAEDYNPAIHTLIEGETAPVALSVGNATVVIEGLMKSDAESAVDFAERVTRHYAPMFASLTDDERNELHERLADLMPPVLSAPGPIVAPLDGIDQAPPVDPAPVDEPAPEPAKETKAQKAARLAQEATDAAAAEAEANKPAEPPVDPAPAPAPAWGTPAAT